MENVLDVYEQPYDPKHPRINLDETSTQLIGEVTPPIPMSPDHTAKQDYEYKRNGTANLFMLYEPLTGRREVLVTDRRTKHDYARALKKLDEMYPDAETIVLVQDNLNTHSLASLYETFEPAEAWRLANRFEMHYTPKHGSWLNMAEIEIGVLRRQCLSRRIDNIELLRREVAAWTLARNLAATKVDWQFTTKDARIKLRRLYPSM